MADTTKASVSDYVKVREAYWQTKESIGPHPTLLGLGNELERVWTAFSGKFVTAEHALNEFARIKALISKLTGGRKLA